MTKIDIKNVSPPSKNDQMEQVSRKATSILKGFDEDSPIENNSMPEYIFKEHFLPKLCGDEIINDDDPIINEWLAISGGIGRSIDVVDANNKKVITVPPIHDVDVIVTENITRDMVRRLETANMETIPVKKTNAVSNALADISNNIEIDEPNDSWTKVLEHYGKTNVAVNADVVDVTVGLDYDSL